MSLDNCRYRSTSRKPACQHAFRAPLRDASGGSLRRWPHRWFDIHTPATQAVRTTATGTALSRGAATTAIARFQPRRRWWPVTFRTPRKRATPTANPSTRRPLCVGGSAAIADRHRMSQHPSPTANARCAKPSRRSRRPAPRLPGRPPRRSPADRGYRRHDRRGPQGHHRAGPAKCWNDATARLC